MKTTKEINIQFTTHMTEARDLFARLVRHEYMTCEEAQEVMEHIGKVSSASYIAKIVAKPVH